MNPTPQKRPFPKPAPWIRTTLRRCWAVVAIVIAAGALLSANGGRFNPDVTSFPAILSMSFPFWMIALAVTALISFFVSRRLSLGLWVAMLFCTGGLADYCPLNLFRSSSYEPADSARVIKVMTYNTYGFCDDENQYPDNTNRTASAIINSGADVVLVQEIGFIDDMPSRHLTSVQVDSLHRLYPYSMFNELKMTGILSRYPLEWVELPQPIDIYAGWEAAKIRVDSTDIMLVSLHLQSLGLNDEDKVIYHEITSGGNIEDWKEAGKIIYDKIASAMKRRAYQARLLRHAIDSVGCRDMILAGDFNDINGCYAMRTICGSDIRSTFTAAGHGPTITYHRDRFFFNIDHILYSGSLRPLEISTGSVNSSDHYPVYATFILDRDR